MKKNYYDDLIQQINTLIESKDDEKALELIEEELALPYVPRKYEEILHNLLEKIGKHDRNEKKETFFSREEMITIIKEYEKHDIDFLLNISSSFDRNNWRGYEKEISEILNLKKLDSKVKSMIYNSLVVQNIDYDFKIDNLTINPFKNKTIFETEHALKNLVNLSSKKLDDPSILNISERIFFIYLMNKFPESLFLKFENISQELINIAKVMLGIKKSETLTKKENEMFNVIKGE